jgi:hypothetical protein
MNKKIDPERLEKLISSIRESLRILHEIRDISESEFKEDIHRQGSAKYHFIVAIEAAIDIANHLISKRGFRAPNDYADTFKVLADSNVIDMISPLNWKKWHVSEIVLCISIGMSILQKYGGFCNQGWEILKIIFHRLVRTLKNRIN